MRLDLDPQLVAVREKARRFAVEKVAPGAAGRDLDKSFPRDLVAAAAAEGWLGCLVPTEFGGSGLGNLGQAVVLEEIAAACASTHVTISVHNSLACSPLLNYGTDRMKRELLPQVARGEKLGAYMLTEPNSGSDAAAMQTTGVQDGDHWVLDGEKMWITTGDVADVGIVFARTELDSAVKDSRAISAFVVPMQTPGVCAGKREAKLGLRGSSTVAVRLEKVRVPAENLLGERARGFNIAMDMLNGGRIGIAIQAIGIARAALDLGIRCGQEPAGGGRRRADSQGFAFRLTEIATEIDAARLLAWRAAVLRDEKAPHVREASMAKLFATTMANRACRDVVMLLGEAGYDGALEAERLFRDVRVTELYEGTTEIQKLVIAKQILES